MSKFNNQRIITIITSHNYRYAYSAELAGIGYSLANTKSGLTLAVKGYSDKQGVLLNKIMDKLTGFKVDPARFTILKELYARGLKNFQAEQPHQHAVYYNSVLLSDRVWHKEELIQVNKESVFNYRPNILSSTGLAQPHSRGCGRLHSEVAGQPPRGVPGVW